MPIKKPIKAKPASKKLSGRMLHFKNHFGSSAKSKLGILTHGERFLEGFKPAFFKGKKTYLIDLRKSPFESPLSVSVIFNRHGGGNKVVEDVAFEARLSFTKTSVVVMAFQGTRRNLSEIREFEEIVKEPIANALLREVENQAKANGYKEIKIRGPEALESYNYPNVYDSLRYRGKTLWEKRKYDNLTAAEEKEFSEIIKTEEKKIQTRMTKIYGDVATALGYKKQKGYFVKKIVRN